MPPGASWPRPGVSETPRSGGHQDVGAALGPFEHPLTSASGSRAGHSGTGREDGAWRSPEPSSLADEIDHLRNALARAHVGEDEGPLAAHPLGVALHDAQIGADQRRKIDLVDHQQIGAGDAGASFPRDLVAGGDVDDVDREVGEFGAEGGGQVVAPDSMKIRSSSGNARRICSTAARLIEASSRIAICGQPPVSTPTMRSGESAPLRIRNSASSRV